MRHAEQQNGSEVESLTLCRSRFVFEFLGQVNVLSGKVRDGVMSQGDAWIRLPEGWSADAVASGLLERGVVVSPGRFFALTGAGQNYIRLAMVPSVEDCQLAADICTEMFSGWLADSTPVLA